MTKNDIRFAARELARSAENIKYATQAYYWSNQNSWTKEEAQEVRDYLLRASSDADVADRIMIEIKGDAFGKLAQERLKTIFGKTPMSVNAALKKVGGEEDRTGEPIQPPLTEEEINDWAKQEGQN